MTTQNIVKKTVDGFNDHYYNFKDFQHRDEYRPYWDKCIECVEDRELLHNIIFCNDYLGIPPVKTFLTVYRDDFIRITGDERARLDAFIKRSIGAFWGMVFKFVFGYTKQKSVSVTMNAYFEVRTATVFSGRPKDFKIV